MKNHQQDAARIINLDEVIFRTSLGKTTIYQLQKSGKFPRGMRLGGTRSTGWLLADVEAWIGAQFNHQDNPSKAMQEVRHA